LRLAVWCGILERTIVVRRGGGWGWRRSRSRGWHFRRWYAAPILVEENSVHSTIQSAMDCRDWHIGFDQFLILDLVGMSEASSQTSARRRVRTSQLNVTRSHRGLARATRSITQFLHSVSIGALVVLLEQDLFRTPVCTADQFRIVHSRSERLVCATATPFRARRRHPVPRLARRSSIENGCHGCQFLNAVSSGTGL
jgi:hypothetical protein